MLSQLFTLVLTPIEECLKMLVDDRITAYLGVSVMSCIVTALIMLIVVRALVNPTAIGTMAVDRENIITAKENKASAIENATNRNKFYKASVDFMRDNKK